jgi:hypothetical protein
MNDTSLNEEILKAYIDKVFEKYDTDGSGGLDVKELTIFFNDLFKALKIPTAITEQNARETMNFLDENSDGTIDKQELFKAFKKLMERSRPQNTHQNMGNYHNYPYGPYGYPYYPPPYQGYNPCPNNPCYVNVQPMQNPFPTPNQPNCARVKQQPTCGVGGGWSKRRC